MNTQSENNSSGNTTHFSDDKRPQKRGDAKQRTLLMRITISVVGIAVVLTIVALITLFVLVNSINRQFF